MSTAVIICLIALAAILVVAVVLLTRSNIKYRKLNSIGPRPKKPIPDQRSSRYTEEIYKVFNSPEIFSSPEDEAALRIVGKPLTELTDIELTTLESSLLHMEKIKKSALESLIDHSLNDALLKAAQAEKERRRKSP